MRVTFDFKMSGETIPKDYRRGIASIIKSALEQSNSDLYKFYYSGKFISKPLTFGIYFPYGVKPYGEYFKTGNKFRLKISSSSYDLISYIYNGLISKRKSSFKLFENEVELISCDLLKPLKILEKETLFKSISPLLVINKGSQIVKNFETNNVREKPIAYPKYLIPGEEGFDEGLNFSVKECALKFLGISEEFEFNYDIVEFNKMPVWHYNQWMSAFNCVIKIRSRPEILQMIYDIGIGVRRSQGFGMLEVLYDRQ